MSLDIFSTALIRELTVDDNALQIQELSVKIAFTKQKDKVQIMGEKPPNVLH